MKSIYLFLASTLLTVSMQAQIIVLDPGHGYGATTSDNPDGRTATEIETALEVGLRTRALIQNSCAWAVYMTRTTNLNSWISVTQRATMANNWNADRILSIHCNAGGGTGTETFYCTADDTTTAPDIAFAQKVQTDMVTNGSWNNRRCVEDNSFLAYHLGVLRYSTATGCLNELGFVDSADATKLTSSTWRDTFALSYFNTLKANLNLTCTATPAPGSFTLTATPTCNATASQVNLTWTASANATSYDLYRNGTLYAANITGTSYTNTAVSPETSYTYFVKAKNAATTQTSNANGTLTVTTLNCAAPGTFTLSATPNCNGTTSQVSLSWTASSNATNYDLYRNGTLYAANIVGTSYTNTIVTAGSSYSYTVTAKNGNGSTSNSNGAQSIVATNCATPGSFTLTVNTTCNATASQVSLSWTAATNATNYDLYRNGVLYASNIAGTSYTNTVVTVGTTYTYNVKAKNTNGTTDNSNGVQTVTVANCASPGAFTLSVTPECINNTTRISITWTASANTSTYDIYRNGALYAADVTGTQFANTYVTAGTTYTYSLVAKNNIGTLSNSNGTLTATALICPPGTFTLTATPTCSGTTSAINLTWTAAANATTYDIYRNGNLYASDVTGTSFLNTYLISAGSSYTYSVKAKNSAGVLANSNGNQTVTAISCAAAKNEWVTTDTLSDHTTVLLYPNPASEMFRLELSQTPESSFDCAIYDVTGKMILKTKVEPSNPEVSISKLPEGIYLVKIWINQEEITTKLIKR